MQFKIKDRVKLKSTPLDLWCKNPKLEIGMFGTISAISFNYEFATVVFDEGFRWDVWIENLDLHIQPKSKVKPVPCKKTISFRG